MNAYQFYTTHTKERVIEVVTAAGTNIDNFKQIALYNGSVSGKLAIKLAAASEYVMTTEEIILQKEQSTAA